MNIKHLEHIFNQYITEYSVHNDVNGDDEGYKWRAVECFKEHWNIDADDFPTMFKNAFKEMSNLIDNSTVQPVGGIRMLLSHTEEIPFVRECFKALFSKDGGDIDARQNRIECFMEKMNKHIEHYAKGSWKYLQLMNSTIYYLNLWCPEENYIYKATEANEWANLIEYGDDFGMGQHFNLRKYYRMCDELLAAIRKNDKIMSLYNERIENISHFNDDCHIMVYDIIYCAKAYGYYKYVPTFKRLSTQQRIERAKNLHTINDLLQQRSELRATNERLTQSMSLPEIIGATISHNCWGDGVVLGVNEYSIVVKFETGEKNIQYPIGVGKYYNFKNEKQRKKLLDYNQKAAEIDENNLEIRVIENELRRYS